ncbi:putative sugar nucleotidyl transferase [Halalkalibaculum sp. DA384]|uniref:putative sugar nucleotidyl transferase n=1 Tax=Halalkalibaculum sp. DA384 TaxID=3373606 RepID=UPI0037545895
MQCCFFEDQLLSRFHPLTLTRPLDDLRVGICTVAEKWKAELELEHTSRLLRDTLKGVFEQPPIDPGEPCLWLNARYLPQEALLERIHDLEVGSCLRSGDIEIAAKVDGAESARWLSNNRANFNSLLVFETDDFDPLEHLWDLFQVNGREIRADIERMGHPSSEDHSISPHAVLENRDQIFIGEGVSVEPGAILVATEGPIYIGPGATICAGAILRGPVAICRESIVNMGAKIYGASTIGPVCKAGGEINNSIFHSYSNKGHEGFIGNSLVGQWCNFGADTNTSNLKNNYSTIRLTDWTSMQQVETGQQFIGTIMGDHSKTAINVQLNTGTVCGVSCNIFTADFPPKLIPSFTWVGTNVLQPYKFDKAVETMEAVMKRRDVELTENYRNMMERIAKKSRS